MTMTPRDARQQEIATSEPRHEEVAALAQRIYLDEGCPSGRAEQHWLQAERLLRATGGRMPLHTDEFPRST